MSGLEVALLGAAASGGAAATAGLIGTAGSLTLGGVLSTVGAITSIFGGAQETNASADAADFNAANTAKETTAEASRIRREGDKRIGRLRANIGKSGVTSAGTPLLALAETAELTEIDALNVQRSGTISTVLDKRRASSLRSSIPFNAGASLLSTAGSRLSRRIS